MLGFVFTKSPGVRPTAFDANMRLEGRELTILPMVKQGLRPIAYGVAGQSRPFRQLIYACVKASAWTAEALGLIDVSLPDTLLFFSYPTFSLYVSIKVCHVMSV